MLWPVSRLRATCSSLNISMMLSTACTLRCPPSLSAVPHLQVLHMKMTLLYPLGLSACPVLTISHLIFLCVLRLSYRSVSLWEEDTGDSERAAGEFYVLERCQGLFPIYISLSTLQASLQAGMMSERHLLWLQDETSIQNLQNSAQQCFLLPKFLYLSCAYSNICLGPTF